MAGSFVVACLGIKFMRSCRPFCKGLTGLIPSKLMPKHSHHTDRLLKPQSELAQAKGVPLSERMPHGKPHFLKSGSKTVKACASLTLSKP